SLMSGSAESELSKFGYDALIRIEKRKPHSFPERRIKHQFDQRSLTNLSDGSLPERGHPDGLAYLMYTSGTSGQPKGVMIEHRSILRLVLNTNYIQLGPTDRILQTGALGFDASTFEIWGPLLNGGAVVLPAPEIPTARMIGDAIRRGQVTTMWLTSSLF